MAITSGFKSLNLDKVGKTTLINKAIIGTNRILIANPITSREAFHFTLLLEWNLGYILVDELFFFIRSS